MMALGYYGGGCLNVSNDNLIFTELFKRPDWMRTSPSALEIATRLGLFERVMTGGIGAPEQHRWPALAAFRDRQGLGLAGSPGAIGWMTKEPNCHLFIEPILTRWPDAHFLYVTRHPLDMAYSDNKGQLGNWSWMFELDPGGYATAEAAQLEYWIRTQRRLDGLLSRYPDRLRPMRFDDFAGDPAAYLGVLSQWLGVPPDEARVASAASGVFQPDSMGRWRTRDLSIFGADQLAFCRDTGWAVDP